MANALKRTVTTLPAHLKQSLTWDRGMQVIIPAKANRKTQRTLDKEHYKARHLVENLFQRMKVGGFKSEVEHFSQLWIGTYPFR